MLWLNLSVPKVMSVALIELVEMTATLNVVVSINSTTVMQTYWTAPMRLILVKVIIDNQFIKNYPDFYCLNVSMREGL